MLNEMIQSVKDAEIKADNILKESEKTSAELIQEAKDQVNQMLDNLKAQLKDESQKKLEQVKSEEAAAEQSFLKELDQELQEQMALARTKEGAVIDAVIDGLIQA